jgi:WD40 repeat protein
VIVWDTVAETGLCRLSGHKGPITQLTFMSQHPILITGSKDSFVKFWDLETQHCFKTVVGHRTEVKTFCLKKKKDFIAVSVLIIIPYEFLYAFVHFLNVSQLTQNNYYTYLHIACPGDFIYLFSDFRRFI